MKRLARYILVLGLGCLFIQSALAKDPWQTKDKTTLKKLSKTRVENLHTMAHELAHVVQQAKPKGLSAAEKEEWDNYTTWVESVRARIDAHSTDLTNTLNNRKLSDEDIASKMAQMNMQFLALQEATQMESRKFQTLSNASKARHDIAMNAIRNMK